MGLSSPVQENFAPPQLANPRTQDVFQSIVKGRKSWKTLRGGEVVWPPDLEAALIEGLENYVPDDSRETRLLGRFPLRNRFISEWIFEKTGKRRTAKQVGSRLQQLRDTCGGRKLLNLLTPRRTLPQRPAPSLSPTLQHLSDISSDGNSRHLDSDSGSEAGAPSTPTDTQSTLQTLLYRGIANSTESPPNSIVYIDLLHPSVNSASKGFLDSRMPSSREDDFMWTERGMDVVRPSSQPRSILDIDPTIAFTSPCLVNAVSVFSVYLEDELVYSEDSPLESSGISTPQDSFVYRTRLLPGYWDKLCQMTDLSRHTIVHRVVDETPLSSTGKAPLAPNKVLFSTMYRFSYSSPAVPLFTNTYETCSDLLSSPAHHKIPSGMDINFDSMNLVSPDGFYDTKSYDRTSTYYDLSPCWSTGTSASSSY